MKRFAGQSPGSSRWRLVVPAAVAVVLLAVGIAFGAYFVTETIDGTSVAQEADQPTAAAATADSSPAAAATPEPSPEPATAPTVTQPTRGALGCVDCWVKGGQALRVTAEDIQLGPDNKYYVADRGDGCAYREDMRGVWELGVEEVILRAPGCEVFWIYVPATGEVKPVTP
ncbi:MAG: hypothetical protein JSU97_04515 [Dehalococcoidia bacterium]|nr:MAG: hypothetical protein JSU97_04515 [Dehalococcoidia bacterium]